MDGGEGLGEEKLQTRQLPPCALSTTLSTAISCDLATEEEDAGPAPGLDWTGGGRRGAPSPKPLWGAWPDFAPEPCVTGCQ